MSYRVQVLIPILRLAALRVFRLTPVRHVRSDVLSVVGGVHVGLSLLRIRHVRCRRGRM